MGFLSRGLEAKGANTVWEKWIQMMDMGGKSKAGPSVGLQQAMRVSAAFACMREISQGLAQVPFKVFKEYDVQRDHPVHKLLTRRPNAWQTGFEFMETIGLHASLGNAYVFKNRYRGKVAEMFILHPGLVKAEQKEDWSVTYKVRGRQGGEVEIPAADIWHIRGASWDGFLGLDLLNLAKEALGLSIALEESVAGLHANGLRPTGTYSVDGALKADQYEQLSAWLKKQAAAGPGTPLVLDRNAKWLQQTMTSVDAQHKEMRDQAIEDVCRFFGILPTIVGFTGDKANTYASAEVMENAHKVRTLGRWYKRVQDSADINLLTDAELDAGIYTKFVANGLMAASATDRSNFYAKALGSGGSPAFMTQDEIRALEDMRPMGGEAAKLPPLIVTPVADPKAEEQAKSIKALETKLDEVKARPAAPPVINITLNQEPVTVKHESGAITVNTPEMKAAAAPVVNVQNDIHVPQGPAPSVTVENNIEKQDAPHVTLEAVLPPLTVNAVMPARKTHTETKIKHDASGKIVGSVTDGTEKDA